VEWHASHRLGNIALSGAPKYTVKFFRQRLITTMPAQSSPMQSSKLLLVLASTVFLGFGSLRYPWPYFLFCPDFLYGFWNGASASTRGAVFTTGHSPYIWKWLLAVTHSLTRSLSRSDSRRIPSTALYCCHLLRILVIAYLHNTE
jgi:hypothetical protein